MRELASWMRERGPQGDIVLGTRCRLARNLQDIPFPEAASREQLREVLSKAAGVTPHLSEMGPFAFREMATMDALEREILVEEHLISPSHMQNPAHKAVILNAERNISIMVNEEDHFRIQVLKPGLQLEQAWQRANSIDDLLEEHLDFAFDLQAGYLTSCPTNVGTALRASVMLHLPALRRVQKVQEVLGAVAKFGLTVRGLYGKAVMPGEMFTSFPIRSLWAKVKTKPWNTWHASRHRFSTASGRPGNISWKKNAA